ncbi:MAG TPA: cupredoxin domain-containing protein [Thermoanaerobaculia bacterium]
MSAVNAVNTVSAALLVVWTADRIVAVIAGAGLLLALFAFFFGKRRPTVVSASGDSPEVTVVVEGGYSPDLIRARVGRPLRLVFDRRDSSPCTDEIVFPDFGIRRALAANARTVVEIRPDRVGEFTFSCGMNMLHGRLQVTA